MEIVPVTEFEGGPDPAWYYAKGHISKIRFLIEFCQQIAYHGFRETVHHDCLPSLEWAKAVTIKSISHEWWHFFPTGCKDPSGCYAQVKGPGRGNFAVTVLNCHGYSNGTAEDVGLVLHGC